MAENPVKDMYYWVQIDEPKDDLAQIEQSLIDMPEGIARNELRICMDGNKYALVHIAANDPDTASLIQEKVSQHLKNKVSTKVVQYDHAQCFYTAYMLHKDNRAKMPVPAKQTLKATPPKPAVHIYPDIQRPNKNAKDKNPTDRATIVANAMVQVLPEVSTQVYLSNLDINRITCMGDRPVKDIVYSAEKGITTKINGSNAFIKLQMHQALPSAVPEVIDDPVELYVVCGSGNDVYTLIGIPKKIPAQWVQLVSKTGNIKKNLELFEGKDFEKKIITFIRQAWTEDFPDSYTVRNINRPMAVQGLEWAGIILRRIVDIEGEGFILKEYILRLNPTAGVDLKNVLEKEFLRPEISENPLAITLDALTLKKYFPTRLFVVEKFDSGHGIGIGGSKK